MGHHHFLWVLLGCFLSSTAAAEVYMSAQEAMELAFPEAKDISKKTTILSKKAMERVKQNSRREPSSSVFSYYRIKKENELLGFAVEDDVPGKHRPITYMLAVTPDVSVKAVEILAYRESRGGEVRNKPWRKQFHGKTAQDPVKLHRDIKNISGATISCRSVSEGIKTQLAFLSEVAKKHGKNSKETPKNGSDPKDKSAKEHSSKANPSKDRENQDADHDQSASAATARSHDDPKAFRHRARYLMGTILEIQAYGPSQNRLDRALTAAFQQVARLEKLLSTYRPDSEVHRFNSAKAHEAVPLSPPTLALFQRAQLAQALTHGAFDPTIAPVGKVWKKAAHDQKHPTPHEIEQAAALTGFEHITIDEPAGVAYKSHPLVEVDFGGIGKGFALDRAVEVLKRHGLRRVLMDFGGQHLAAAPPPGQAGWSVYVPDPRAGERRYHEASLRHGSISSTSDTERGRLIEGRFYSHVIDPRTARPVSRPSQVTVMARSATYADAWSSAGHVLGAQKLRHLISGFPHGGPRILPAKPAFREARSRWSSLRAGATSEGRL